MYCDGAYVDNPAVPTCGVFTESLRRHAHIATAARKSAKAPFQINLRRNQRETTINIPLGAAIRVEREDGSSEIFVFHGSDARGVIYEDKLGKRHADIGGYLENAMKEDARWKVI